MALMMVFALAACATEEAPAETTAKEETTMKAEDATEASTEETTEKAMEEVAFSLGLVTDVGGIDDKSFNQSTWEGIERFAADHPGVETTAVQSDSDADYIPNLSTLAEDELDLVVAAGFLFADAIGQVAADFPEQQFLIIDVDWVQSPNMVNAVFAEHEGSFLAGVAAALKAEEDGQNKVGFIGGVSGELIGKFEAGFKAGVMAVNPDLEIMSEYAESFVDVQLGQSIATRMYDEGAYIIYHAAGNVGNGIIAEAKNRVANDETVWVIGVDKDQYPEGIYEDNKSVVLTSMMKRVDVAAYNVAEMAKNGTFPGGEVLTFNLENGGVALPGENPNLSEAIVDAVEAYKMKVLSGEITVPSVPAN